LLLSFRKIPGPAKHGPKVFTTYSRKSSSCSAASTPAPETEANVVTLHPATIAVYLDAVEQLAKALSAADAKAACLKLRELIDCIVVAPRSRPGDPINFEVRGRLAALMQPHPDKVSVGAWCPRGGIEP
jgi:hypothetical protein